MVVGHIGGGHNDRRLADSGELGQGGGPAPAQHQVRGHHHRGHVIDVLPQLDLRRQGDPRQGLLHGPIVPPRPVDVVEGGSLPDSPADEIGHIAVHHLRPQAAPIGQDQGPVIPDAQGVPGLLPGQAEEFPPDRGPGDHHPVRVMVVLPGVLIAHHHPVGHLGQPLGGQAGHRVGLVHRRGDAPAGGLMHHGIGGISPRPHHQVRLKAVQNPGGLLFGHR